MESGKADNSLKRLVWRSPSTHRDSSWEISNNVTLFKEELLPWKGYFIVKSLQDLSLSKTYFLEKMELLYFHPRMEDILCVYVALIEYILTHYQKEVVIFLEFSHTYYYVSLVGLSPIPQKVLHKVIRQRFKDLTYRYENPTLSFRVAKNVSESNNDKKKEEVSLENILRRTHEEKISASEFMSGLSFDILHKVGNLTELIGEIDLAINAFSTQRSLENLYQIAHHLHLYRDTLLSMGEFGELVVALDVLIDFLKGVQDLSQEQAQWDLAIDMLFLLNADFEKWQESLFFEQSANDIHYLDASLLSSIYQIKHLFERDSVLEEEDIEFF